jgi:hypothetical protein
VSPRRRFADIADVLQEAGIAGGNVRLAAVLVSLWLAYETRGRILDSSASDTRAFSGRAGSAFPNRVRPSCWGENKGAKRRYSGFGSPLLSN